MEIKYKLILFERLEIWNLLKINCKLNKNFGQWWYWWLQEINREFNEIEKEDDTNYLIDIAGINIHKDCESDSKIYFCHRNIIKKWGNFPPMIRFLVITKLQK